MERIRLYENWEKNLDFWRNKLRHLQWISNYRMNLINMNIDLKGKKVLDMGSGPQFTTDLLTSYGAKVVTLDKYAPCDICCDINHDFTTYFQEQFDLVVVGAVIRYVVHKKTFFKRLDQILKPAGVVFIDEFVHNYFNDFFLEAMVIVGAMEQWPQENFVPLEKLEEIIHNTKSFSIKEVYSCWPNFFLKGKQGLPTWYTLILNKYKEN